MASFSDEIKSKIEAMTPVQQKQATKSAQATFVKGTPEYSQYKADMAQYEYEANSFFNTQKDIITKDAEYKQSEINSQKEYSATLGQRYEGFVQTAYTNSDIAKAINRFAIENVYSSGAEDKQFKEYNTDTSITKALAIGGIQQSQYAYELLQGAKNQKDFDFYMHTLRTDEKFRESSAYLTSTKAGIAGVEGALFTDPTMLAYMPARLALGSRELYSFNKLQGGARLSAVVGTNAALQGSLSALRTYGNPERTSTDLMLDIAFGGIVDGYFTMKQLGRLDKLPTGNIADDAIDINDFAKMHEDSIKTNSAMDNLGIKEYDFARSDIHGYKWSTKLEDMAIAEVTTAKVVAEKQATRLDNLTKITSEFIPSKDTTESILKSLGKSDEEISTALQEAKTQQKELLAMVRGASQGDEKVKIQELSRISDMAREIGKVSPEVETSVMKEISKSIGKSISQTGKIIGKDVVGKTKEGVSFKLGKAKASYEIRAKNIDNIIVNKKAKEDLSKAKQKKVKAKQEVTTKDKTEYSGEVKALETEQAVFNRISSVVDEIIDEAKTAIDDMIIDGLPTKAEKEVFKKESSEDLTDIFGEEVKVEIKDEEAIVKGKLTFSVDKTGTANVAGNTMKVGTILALGASVSMANDGSSITFSDAPFIIIAIAAGLFGLRSLRNAGGIKAVIKNANEKVMSADFIARQMEKPMFKSWEGFRTEAVDKANFEVINSMQVVMNNGTELSKKIGQRLGFDAVNPQETLNAMQSKNIMSRNLVQQFTEPEEVNYKAWLKENKFDETMFDEWIEGGAETKYREMFLSQVTDYVEFGKYADSPTVVKQGKVFIDVLSDASNTGIINKIIGFTEESIGKIQNYIPRIANKDFIRSVIQYGGKDKLKEQFHNALKKAVENEGKVADLEKIDKLADDMIEWYADVGGKYANKSKAEAVLRAMKRLGYDMEGIDADLLIAESKTNSDAISRGKFRIPMDFSEFKEFKVNINGSDETVSLGTVFERNSNSLVKMYSDQVSGSVALRRSTTNMIDGMKDGVTSESALRELIDKEPNTDVRDVLHTYVSVVAGKPLYESTHMAGRIVDALRDLSYARLAGTQFAMFSEYATAISNMMMSKPAMAQGLVHLRNIVRRMVGKQAENTAMARTIQRLTGQGSSAVRRENTLKNIDNVFNMAANTDGNTAEKISAMVKYLSLKFTNILHADDAMKTISGIAQTDYLSKWLKGEVTISKTRLERFGINDKFTEMFKGGFKSDSEGNLLADFDIGWSQAKKDEYARVINKMIMVDSPEAIASALPHVALTSDAGRLTGFMTHFTATSYTTKALQGLKRPDVKSFSDTMIYFLGTYAGIYARHIATKGEEPDEKETLHKAIMMMPLMSPFGIYSMVTDPMTTSMPNDIITEMSKLQDIIE